MKKLIFLTVIILSMLIHTLSSYATESLPEYIKIGLFYSKTALEACSISCDGDVIVYYDGEEAATGRDLSVSVDENLMVNVYSGDVLLISCDNKEIKFAPTEGYISLNGKKYRGTLQIINLKNGKMTLINKVNLEEYLYGVLPLEMATGWPMEALKAQAVCARTYALTSLGRFKDYGFDLTDTTLSQVYGGVGVEKEDCTQAVTETSGMVVTYNNMPASVFYYASSSGESLDVKDVWGSNYPYLVSVKDEYQAEVVKDNAKWTANFSVEEMTNKMNNNGYDLGEIQDIVINKTSPQGAVTMLTIKGSKSNAVFERERARTIFGFRSQVYTVSSEKEGDEVAVLGATGVKKTNNITVLSSKGTEKLTNSFVKGSTQLVSKNFGGQTTGFSFVGYGYGHGIGMSQNGAKGMAKNGFTYDEILTHYFKGTSISYLGGEV